MSRITGLEILKNDEILYSDYFEPTDLIVEKNRPSKIDLGFSSLGVKFVEPSPEGTTILIVGSYKIILNEVFKLGEIECVKMT